MQDVIYRRICLEPFLAMLKRLPNPIIQKLSGFGMVGAAADMLESPFEGAHAPVVIRAPSTMLISADLLLEPGHIPQIIASQVPIWRPSFGAPAVRDQATPRRSRIEEAHRMCQSELDSMVEGTKTKPVSFSAVNSYP